MAEVIVAVSGVDTEYWIDGRKIEFIYRCKDCKHCRSTTDLLSEGERLADGASSTWCDCGYYLVTEDDYCSKAERRTE